MDCSDEEAVRKAIEEDRQSVSKAREAWQNATGKEASDITFIRFLETLVQDISVYENAQGANPHRSSTHTFHMAGNSRMRIFTSHPRRQPGLISLA